jgi:hypothetical protein
MLVAVLVVLVAVFFVATGRGGELSHERPDYAPLDLGPVSATDVAMLRPPTALWGYNVEVTDEALNRVALAIRDRDARIAYLQQQLAQVPPEAVQDRPGPQVPRVPYAMPAFPVPRDQGDTQTLHDRRTSPTGPGPVPGDDETERLVPRPTLPSRIGQPPAGQEPYAGQDPAEQQNPVGRHHRTAEDDIVPWDEPADHDDVAGDEFVRGEHPVYRDDPAGDDPVGRPGPPGSGAGE